MSELECVGPQVRPVAEVEMFKVLRSGKRRKAQWKRMVTKVTFVGNNFTRKPPKYERFIRPTGMILMYMHTHCYSSMVVVMGSCSSDTVLFRWYLQASGAPVGVKG